MQYLFKYRELVKGWEYFYIKDYIDLLSIEENNHAINNL